MLQVYSVLIHDTEVSLYIKSNQTPCILSHYCMQAKQECLVYPQTTGPVLFCGLLETLKGNYTHGKHGGLGVLLKAFIASSGRRLSQSSLSPIVGTTSHKSSDTDLFVNFVKKVV